MGCTIPESRCQVLGTSSGCSLCRAVLPSNPDEDTITINVVDVLSKDADARRWFYHLEYPYEPFGYTSDGWAYSKGRVDMAVLLDFEREHYLAYECKKLNVTKNSRFRSLAMEYVKDGVVRFVKEQYAAGLPLGCMLGYVMDKNLEKAQEAVASALLIHKESCGLTTGPTAAHHIGGIRRFVSRHARSDNGTEIELRHALLAF